MAIRRVVNLGQMLGAPAAGPTGTGNPTRYELGKCFQLDRDRCLLAASLDEQGGGDLCVGNDGFVVRSLAEIDPGKAIALNRPDPEFRGRAGTGFLAKYPLTGGFVPAGAKFADGGGHAGAGTGVLAGAAVAFAADKTSAEADSEILIEVIGVRWDGSALTVTGRELMKHALGYRLQGVALSHFCPKGQDWLAPFVTDQGIVVFRLAFSDGGWRFASCGEPFVTHRRQDWFFSVGESEPSIQECDGTYVATTRGADGKSRVYRSSDGLNYTLWFERDHPHVPQALNKGLDGSLYLATNPGVGWLRNPLAAFPLADGAFGEAIVVHDQDGIRDDKGEKVPFIDHGVGSNVYLEGRWRHLLWYRVCDLRERTFHRHQAAVAQQFHGSGGPIARRAESGLYVAELEFDSVTAQPFRFE
ncbi:MAG: hypothetical protein GXY33_06955 [Phycisphaerae bacterium]|nr:hypothetical protein [Phycisphaerae bacterium]